MKGLYQAFLPLQYRESLPFNWLHMYIDSQGTGPKALCDVAVHGPFYATCQAVFYVVIFRHQQILDGNLKKGKHDKTFLIRHMWIVVLIRESS